MFRRSGSNLFCLDRNSVNFDWDRKIDDRSSWFFAQLRSAFFIGFPVDVLKKPSPSVSEKVALAYIHDDFETHVSIRCTDGTGMCVLGLHTNLVHGDYLFVCTVESQAPNKNLPNVIKLPRSRESSSNDQSAPCTLSCHEEWKTQTRSACTKQEPRYKLTSCWRWGPTPYYVAGPLHTAVFLKRRLVFIRTAAFLKRDISYFSGLCSTAAAFRRQFLIPESPRKRRSLFCLYMINENRDHVDVTHTDGWILHTQIQYNTGHLIRNRVTWRKSGWYFQKNKKGSRLGLRCKIRKVVYRRGSKPRRLRVSLLSAARWWSRVISVSAFFT